MTEFNYPKGKWSVSYDKKDTDKHGYPFYTITGGDGYFTVASFTEGESTGFNFQNIMPAGAASLMGASKDMYELLIAIRTLDNMNLNMGGAFIPPYMRNALYKVIALAEGGIINKDESNG